MKTGKDKILHFSISLCLTVTLGWIVGIPAGAAITLVIGIGKEVYDKKTPANHFCFGDLAADLAGITLGVGILLL